MRNFFTLVAAHQGMGDHILCNGLYRELKLKCRFLLIPVKNGYRRQVKRMLKDTTGILILPLAEKYYWRWMRIYQLISLAFGIRLVSVGSFGKDFFRVGERFDANFYYQARIPLELRWSESPASNAVMENLLFDQLNCGDSSYIFLHEDRHRGFVIDRNLIKSPYGVIEPNPQIANRFSIFDYKKVVENAAEIHVIESSFAAFVESLEVPKVPKFAHRYARGHAMADFRHEFTYRANWKILKQGGV